MAVYNGDRAQPNAIISQGSATLPKEKITPHARTVLPTYDMQYYFSSSVILSTNHIAVEQFTSSNI